MWGNWSATRAGVYYIDIAQPPQPEAKATIRFFDPTTGSRRIIYSLPRIPLSQDNGLAVSPDDRWILFGQWDQRGSDIWLIDGLR